MGRVLDVVWYDLGATFAMGWLHSECSAIPDAPSVSLPFYDIYDYWGKLWAHVHGGNSKYTDFLAISSSLRGSYRHGVMFIAFLTLYQIMYY